MKPLLTILIPCIPSRWDKVIPLVEKIQSQIDEHNASVELIMLMDNKSMTIGEKRNALLTLINGEYFCMIDDDDNITDSFIYEICDAIHFHGVGFHSPQGVDVISFDSIADIDGRHAVINMSILNPTNEQWSPDTIVKRKPWHMCAWRTDKFKHVSFGLTMYGEDEPFMTGANDIVETEHHIDKALHIYTWRADVTEAFER